MRGACGHHFDRTASETKRHLPKRAETRPIENSFNGGDHYIAVFELLAEKSHGFVSFQGLVRRCRSTGMRFTRAAQGQPFDDIVQFRDVRFGTHPFEIAFRPEIEIGKK